MPPLHLNWAAPGRQVDLADRRQHARAYEVVLRECQAVDIGRHVDGAPLVDLWNELVLPGHVHEAWAPLIAAALTAAPAPEHRAGPTPGQPASPTGRRSRRRR